MAGCLKTFLKGTTIPIPKSKNVNVTNSDNYRGITLRYVFGRIFYNIILNRYASLLVSSELQFGFKRKCSTTMCTMIVKEVISYYTYQNSNVFRTFLDASKPTDKVYVTVNLLFSLLLDRNIPPQIIRALLIMYTGQ